MILDEEKIKCEKCGNVGCKKDLIMNICKHCEREFNIILQFGLCVDCLRFLAKSKES